MLLGNFSLYFHLEMSLSGTTEGLTAGYLLIFITHIIMDYGKFAQHECSSLSPLL
jgi:hypothetical protein